MKPHTSRSLRLSSLQYLHRAQFEKKTGFEVLTIPTRAGRKKNIARERERERESSVQVVQQQAAIAAPESVPTRDDEAAANGTGRALARCVGWPHTGAAHAPPPKCIQNIDQSQQIRNAHA